jgi:hypothetical protein
MSYSLLTYEQILSEIESIKANNLHALDKNAEFFETNIDLATGTGVEYLLHMFDNYRLFFNQVEDFLNDIQFELEQRNITYGLIHRINRFGEEADTQLLPFKRYVDKRDLNSVPELRTTFNRWYEIVANNLIAISELQHISNALNSNFRYITPFKEVPVENISLQSPDGISVTKDNEIYIDGNAVKLEGQRKKILLFLIENYYMNPDLAVSWTDIEPEIRETEVPMEKDVVVDRISSLRTRLTKQGFGSDVIEIINITKGIDATWKLVKH